MTANAANQPQENKMGGYASQPFIGYDVHSNDVIHVGASAI